MLTVIKNAIIMIEVLRFISRKSSTYCIISTEIIITVQGEEKGKYL